MQSKRGTARNSARWRWHTPCMGDAMRTSLLALCMIAAACSSGTSGLSGSGGQDAGTGGKDTGTGGQDSGTDACSASEAVSSMPQDTSPAPTSADLQQFETDNAAFTF